MRDIKFRAIDNNGEWCYGLPNYDLDGDIEMSKPDGYTSYGDIEKTLGQYTGLKDKNGVEIYEGDIIPYGGNNYAVEMCGPSWSFPEFVGQDYYGHDEPELQDWSEFEVIGNIHQNPELLGNA